jgi:hypothetical protein
MATRSALSASEREARFFFLMACVMAAAVVSGFGANLATGRVSFSEQPWYAHIHAFFFFGWMALYVLQTGLVATGSLALHRRIGWIALFWAPAMVVLGIVLSINAVRNRPLPPDIPVTLILVGNIVQIVIFGVLVFVAIGQRRRTGVHRRLLYIATSQLTGQALGRLASILLPDLPGVLIATAGVTALSAVGALHDLRLSGRVHKLWWLGMALPLVRIAFGALFVPSAPGIAFLHLLLDGSPGAAALLPRP